ncbi:unnamed protein product [Blepharisma stoltei]|uniref:Uncharacterized protein n=1 Tax=Blepharisma stoltei TaxID=1481888 RepID=A0AAU9IZR3_9CILI|nr:unnamed protein product [Blepharisma stoltei]
MGDLKEDTDDILNFAELIDKYNSSKAHNRLKNTIAALTAAIAILLLVLAFFYVQHVQMLDIIQKQASILEGKEEMIKKILEHGDKNSWSNFLMRQLTEYSERAILGYGYTFASKVLSFF